MKPVLDKIPDEFVQLYTMASQVYDYTKSNVLSYNAISSFQSLIFLYSAIINKFSQTSDLKSFSTVLKQAKDMPQSDLSTTHPISILLAMREISFSIISSIEYISMSIGENVSRKKSNILKQDVSALLKNLIYLSRLALTYSKYFDDSLLDISNKMWREYSPLIPGVSVLQLSSPSKVHVMSDESSLFARYIEFKARSTIESIYTLSNEIEMLKMYKSPDDVDYVSRFSMEFTANLTKSLIPKSLKKGEQNEG